MSDSDDIEEVRRRLEEIQRHKRGRMRWGVSRHTAELALVALDDGAQTRPRRGKTRRRKRHKRLL